MTSAPQDDDRTEWDLAWANRPIRRLATPVRIDVRLFPEWGEPTEVHIVAAPPQYAERIYPQTETCPVCGDPTSDRHRLLVKLYPNFSNGLSIGIDAWAHVKCLAACEEVPGPAPIPW